MALTMTMAYTVQETHEGIRRLSPYRGMLAPPNPDFQEGLSDTVKVPDLPSGELT